VLVGTVAIETSERLSKYLDRAGVRHEVLNAKQHEREAGIIAQAGRSGAVTIATNMAGRGVDILLGGNPEGLAREKLRRQGIEVTDATPEQWQQALSEAKAECEADRQKVLAAGGLFVLGTERHEARRIDNQLRGRCGRQGDPGASRFYLSLEDDLMKRFGGERVKGFMSWASIPEDEPIEHGMISRSIAQAQVRVEGFNFDMRKRVVEYDDVVNKQREVIYALRREIVAKDNLREDYLKILEEGVIGVLDEFAPENIAPEDWDVDGLYQRLFRVFPVPARITPQTMAGLSAEALETMLLDAVHEAYDQKEAELGAEMMRRLEKFVMLRAIDQHWQRHLTDLDILREGIGLVSIAQRDPLVEYKRQAFGMWQGMMDAIREQAAQQLLTAQVRQQQPVPLRRQMQQLQAVRPGAAESKPEPVRTARKLGRNDPCWCGSGKKYKHCHLKTDQG
jgi:preprotein translocase subunit SecA